MGPLELFDGWGVSRNLPEAPYCVTNIVDRQGPNMEWREEMVFGDKRKKQNINKCLFL